MDNPASNEMFEITKGGPIEPTRPTIDFLPTKQSYMKRDIDVG